MKQSILKKSQHQEKTPASESTAHLFEEEIENDDREKENDHENNYNLVQVSRTVANSPVISHKLAQNSMASCSVGSLTKNVRFIDLAANQPTPRGAQNELLADKNTNNSSSSNAMKTVSYFGNINKKVSSKLIKKEEAEEDSTSIMDPTVTNFKTYFYRNSKSASAPSKKIDLFKAYAAQASVESNQHPSSLTNPISNNESSTLLIAQHKLIKNKLNNNNNTNSLIRRNKKLTTDPQSFHTTHQNTYLLKPSSDGVSIRFISPPPPSLQSQLISLSNQPQSLPNIQTSSKNHDSIQTNENTPVISFNSSQYKHNVHAKFKEYRFKYDDDKYNNSNESTRLARTALPNKANNANNTLNSSPCFALYSYLLQNNVKASLIRSQTKHLSQLQIDLDVKSSSNGIPKLKKVPYNQQQQQQQHHTQTTSLSFENTVNSPSVRLNSSRSSKIGVRPSVNIKQLLSEPTESTSTNLSFKPNNVSSSMSRD